MKTLKNIITLLLWGLVFLYALANSKGATDPSLMGKPPVTVTARP